MTCEIKLIKLSKYFTQFYVSPQQFTHISAFILLENHNWANFIYTFDVYLKICF